MASEMAVTDLPLGAVQRGPIQFIKQQSVDAEKDLFELTLPGHITRCGGAVAFAVKAIGRVVVDGAVPTRAATVSAQVCDERGLSHAVNTLLAKVAPLQAAGYAIRLGSRHNSYADIIAKAEAANGGGCRNSEGRVAGFVSVGLTADPEGALTWSIPVRAVITSQLSNSPEFPPEALQAPIAAVSNATACVSVWHGLIDRWTECTGPCSSGTCACRRTAAGTPVVTCEGWTTCSCI